MDRMSTLSWKEAIKLENERLGIKPNLAPPRPEKKPSASVGHIDTMAQRDEMARVLRPRHVAGEMNGIEKAYAAHLESRRVCGEIIGWKFEAIKLKLARATFYNPDFLVIALEYRLELHETKGFWEDDAILKFKLASEMYPEFRIIAVRRLRKPTRWSFKDSAFREVSE